ncbi:Putative transposase of IS4/5 family [Methylobacterium sp. 174MFSha1.1]|nr:Putative transposase of IS4/5 family [Methylobacterium sp. 174MFSha1.1]
MSLDRPAYPCHVSDEKWALVAPDLALSREDSGQRDHELRDVFNGLRYIVKTGVRREMTAMPGMHRHGEAPGAETGGA